MNLRSLHYFLIAAEEMNFTKAAERLFISQQALSSHIKRLEDEYGVRLFERRPALHLTLEGEEMQFYARQILADEMRMRTVFSDIRESCRGKLKIGISRLRASAFFPKIWSFYHPTHPNISIELISDNSSKLNDLLLSGKIDLYIGIDVPFDANQKRIELTREKIQCCMAQSLLEQYRPENWSGLLLEFQNGISLSSVTDIPFLTLKGGNRLRQGLDLFFSRQREKPYYLFECDQQELIYELTKDGAGIGILSPVILYQNLKEIKELGSSFCIFPIQDEIPENTVWLVSRNDFQLPHYALDLIQVICMVFKSYSGMLSKRSEASVKKIEQGKISPAR